MSFYGRYGKRLLDVTLATTGLIVLSPLLGATALAIRVNLGKPVIFKHSRPGKNTEHFNLFKFRTMTNASDSDGNLLPDEQRITKLGSLLRRTSLDELPELVNVIKGDLSLVGPRPLLSRYLPFYTSEELRRFDIRPGLTGWAQIHGRNSVCWDDRLSQDVWYRDNVTFALDMRIILETLKIVIRREGVEIVPNAVMQSLDEERATNA